MFCPKCGKSVADGAKFCPSCGNGLSARGASVAQPTPPRKQAVTESFDGAARHQFQQVKPTPSASKAKAGRSINWGWILAAGDVLLILLAFAPWVSLNVVMYSMQYSLLDLVTMAFRFNSLTSDFLGSSSGAIAALGTVGCLLLILIVSLLAIDAYKRIKGDSFPVFAFVVAALFSTVAIVAIFVVDSAIASESSDYLGSSALTGTIAPTLWVWVFLSLSVACMVVYMKRGK